MVNCRCAEIQHLLGAAAQRYEREHLRELVVDGEKWETLFGCPETGRLWKEYLPHAEYHGGGLPELVQLSPEAAAAEFGWSPAPDERLQAIRAAKKYDPRVDPDELWRSLRARGIKIDREAIRW